MTDHPITPPPELVEEWADDMRNAQHFATQAARWGADQELEACVEWVADHISIPESTELRATRRPKPPSLKEQALNELRRIPIDPEAGVEATALDTIRRALEQLDD